LKKYKEKHGDCLVPQDWEEDPQLGGWVMRQRLQNGYLKLRQDFVERLSSIDFVWRLRERRPTKSTKYDNKWMERYHELTAYRREHNDCEVPSNYHNKKLANWVQVQRRQYKWANLRLDRVRLLDAIGFTWCFESIHEKTWQKRYEEVRTYYDSLSNSAKQKVNSPADGESKKVPVLNDRLRTWINHQRAA
jgi:Helicase associated domain